MSFVNTVDLIGDEALTAKIIERTITEIVDNNITKTAANAFRYCDSLILADFTALTEIGSASFAYCSGLSAFILRSESVVPLTYGAVFMWSSIERGNGYIYVPSALVDSYKSATNWSNFAGKIRAIEDYPDITGG